MDKYDISQQFFSNKNTKKICYYKNDKLHRIDGPAEITFYNNGQIKRESYYENGEISLKSGIRIIRYTEDGIMQYRETNINSTLILTEKYDPITGNIYTKFYTDLLHGGLFNNSNGPACVEYYPNGQISKEMYVVDKVSSRDDGPAVINYNKNGSIISKKYFINGKEIDEFKFLVSQYEKIQKSF